MSASLTQSRIDIIRARAWGNSTLRLLQSHPTTGNALKLILLVSNGWFIGRDIATQISANNDFLTIDLIRNPSLTRQILTRDLLMVEVVVSDTESYRYSLSSKTPSFAGGRFVNTVTPAYNENRQILA